MTEALPDILSSDEAVAAFGVSCLQLCQASYAVDDTEIPDWVALVQPFSTGSRWVCGSDGWQADDDDSLLAFVASYGLEGETPLAYAVVLRGTDTDGPGVWAIVNQIYDDVDVVLTSPVPWNEQGPGYIARGTSDAFSTISAFDFGQSGATLQSYVVGLIQDATTASGNQPYLFVVGHSLGGCLASVFAPDLAFALGEAGLDKKVVSATFAAPTAGDQDFVDEANGQCFFNFRYRNDRDIVPRAWENLSTLFGLYDDWGIDMGLGDDVVLAATIAALDVADVAYIQPSANKPLSGPHEEFIPAPSNYWQAEAEFQHHTSTYMALIGGTNLWNLEGAGTEIASGIGDAAKPIIGTVSQ